MNGKKIDFSEDAIKEFLDARILFWMRKRDQAVEEECYDKVLFPSMKSSSHIQAMHYIDAYQSVRAALLGEILLNDVKGV